MSAYQHHHSFVPRYKVVPTTTGRVIHSHGQIKSGHLSELDAAVLSTGGKHSSSVGSGCWTLEHAAVDDAVLATRSGSTLPFYQHAPRRAAKVQILCLSFSGGAPSYKGSSNALRRSQGAAPYGAPSSVYLALALVALPRHMYLPLSPSSVSATSRWRWRRRVQADIPRASLGLPVCLFCSLVCRVVSCRAVAVVAVRYLGCRVLQRT